MTGNTHRNRVWVLAVVALGVGVAVALSLGYLSTQNQSPAPAATVDKLSIALPALPHAALIHVAAAQGYLAEEGLEPAITPVSHGKAAIDAGGKAGPGLVLRQMRQRKTCPVDPSIGSKAVPCFDPRQDDIRPISIRENTNQRSGRRPATSGREMRILCLKA